jgi:DNA-binding transcriptional regulator YiaG
VPGWYPDGDGDAIHSGEDLRAYDEAFKELREAYAARIKTVRKKLGLTQEEAGVIIGGGKRAFQKYESGRTPPSDAAVGLIEIWPVIPRRSQLCDRSAWRHQRRYAGSALTARLASASASSAVFATPQLDGLRCEFRYAASACTISRALFTGINSRV